MNASEIAAENPQATSAHTMKIAVITVIQYQSMERLHCLHQAEPSGGTNSGAGTTGPSSSNML